MGCLGIKMPELRYEQDRSSLSPISHDEEIRAVLIVAERGTASTTLSMQVHASHLTPWKRWYFCLNLLHSSVLCCVSWDSISGSGRRRGKCLSVSTINKPLRQAAVMCSFEAANWQGEIHFFNQHTAGIQTSAKRDPDRVRPRAVSSWTVIVCDCLTVSQGHFSSDLVTSALLMLWLQPLQTATSKLQTGT